MTLLVDGAVKAAVLLIFAVGAAIFMRRRSAAARHWVLTLGVGCAVLVPSLALVVPSWSISLPPADLTRAAVPSSPVATTVIKIEPVGTSPAPAPAAPPKVAPRSAAPLLVALWLAGFAALASRLVAGLVRLKRVANGARRVTNGAWLRCADEIARASGLKRPVVLLQSEQPALLVTWGWRSPKVLLPAAARLWTGDRMAIVLRHELAHIRRGDWAAQLAGELLRSLHWFNPLVWVACRRLRRESEQACDDAVVQSGVDPTDYASHLVDLARTLNAGRRAGVPAMAMARPSSLEGRISAMLNSRLDRRPLSRAAQAATAAAFIAATLSIAGAAQARYSTLSGTVVDQTGGFLPDTTLVLTNTASKARHEVHADRTGRFEFVGLPSGDYMLQVAQTGFTTLTESITIARDVGRTIELQVGSLQETISIVGGPRDETPDPTRAERLQAVRQKAQERQLRATERCVAATSGGLGGNILQPWKIRDVKPIYPEAASSAQVGGVVTMAALIGTDGMVKEVNVVSSPHPDLDRAATEAVRQWEFTPTILNCTPIEVRMNVTASFKP